MMERLADVWGQVTSSTGYVKLHTHAHDVANAPPLASLRLPAHTKVNRSLLLLVILLTAALLYTTTHPPNGAVAAPSFVRLAVF